MLYVPDDAAVAEGAVLESEDVDEGRVPAGCQPHPRPSKATIACGSDEVGVPVLRGNFHDRGVHRSGATDGRPSEAGHLPTS